MNDRLSGKELFIQFTVTAFRKLLSIYVFSYFPFGFEGRMWDLIVSVPDHCLLFYFPMLDGRTLWKQNTPITNTVCWGIKIQWLAFCYTENFYFR